jgi:hypothetical protein
MAAYDITKTVLAGVDNTTLQTWLSQAQAALNALVTGQQAVTVTVTGGGQHREVSFNKTNQANLIAWINMLQAQLGIKRTPRRPLFGGFG